MLPASTGTAPPPLRTHKVLSLQSQTVERGQRLRARLLCGRDLAHRELFSGRGVQIAKATRTHLGQEHPMKRLIVAIALALAITAPAAATPSSYRAPNIVEAVVGNNLDTIKSDDELTRAVRIYYLFGF